MHISEGILSGSVLFSGAALAAAGTAVGLKKLDYDRIAKTGILSAAFFVASLIHIPLGPTSIHLVLNGIVGILLGWCAFPAILVALLLQALFFQFGGLTTLGINAIIMALPAVISFYLFSPFINHNQIITIVAAYACGFFCVFFSAIIMGAVLIFTGENFIEISALIVLSNLPIMIIEGFVTTFCVLFLKKVQPELIKKGFKDKKKDCEISA